MGKPVAYASSILLRPMTRPTWPGAVGVPSAPAKNTRSPGSTFAAGTCGRPAHWACDVRGMLIPAARYAIMTSPEQSHASGPVPPHRYGLPSCPCAKLIAVETAAFGETSASSVPVPAHDAEPAPDAEPELEFALTVKPPLA